MRSFLSLTRDLCGDWKRKAYFSGLFCAAPAILKGHKLLEGNLYDMKKKEKLLSGAAGLLLALAVLGSSAALAHRLGFNPAGLV